MKISHALIYDAAQGLSCLFNKNHTEFYLQRDQSQTAVKYGKFSFTTLAISHNPDEPPPWSLFNTVSSSAFSMAITEINKGNSHLSKCP